MVEHHVWLRFAALEAVISLTLRPLPTNRASEEAFLEETDSDCPGSEWERVACLCDFNPKTNKQSKDVSRMRSVLIALKQTPLVR